MRTHWNSWKTELDIQLDNQVHHIITFHLGPCKWKQWNVTLVIMLVPISPWRFSIKRVLMPRKRNSDQMLLKQVLYQPCKRKAWANDILETDIIGITYWKQSNIWFQALPHEVYKHVTNNLQALKTMTQEICEQAVGLLLRQLHTYNTPYESPDYLM